MTGRARPYVRSLLAIHMAPAFKPGHAISNGRLCAKDGQNDRTHQLARPDAAARVPPALLRATELMT